MLLPFVAEPKSVELTVGRGAGWWAVLVGVGLIVLGHGCHSGDHEIDNEPALVVPQESAYEDGRDSAIKTEVVP